MGLSQHFLHLFSKHHGNEDQQAVSNQTTQSSLCLCLSAISSRFPLFHSYGGLSVVKTAISSCWMKRMYRDCLVGYWVMPSFSTRRGVGCLLRLMRWHNQIWRKKFEVWKCVTAALYNSHSPWITEQDYWKHGCQLIWRLWPCCFWKFFFFLNTRLQYVSFDQNRAPLQIPSLVAMIKQQRSRQKIYIYGDWKQQHKKEM